MSRSLRSAAVGLCAAAAACALPAAAMAVPHSNAKGLTNRAVCAKPAAGAVSCDARVVTHRDGSIFNAKPNATSGPAGYHPADLQSAYKLPSSPPISQTVAIVDAYNDPYAFSNVNTYRTQFGIPTLRQCTASTVSTSSGCFAQVGQTGTSTLPRNNGGWAQEESLDLDMVSAVCPNCNIILVEASTSSMANLGTAVNEAAKLHATEISNSYGGGDSSGDSSSDAYYNHPGIAITASSGDNGYGVEYPAASQYVTAVGGTSLSGSISAGWTETAWTGAGSGCSAYETQPSWQGTITNLAGSCSRRAVADVSAVADPNTGVSVYDSYSYQGYSGWMVFGGTSVASPIIASVYALAGNASSVNYGSFPYSHTSGLNDVTSGSNGSCSGSDLCTAGAGWDGPTGLGSPSGTSAF